MYKVLTVGEWKEFPVGTVLHREDGAFLIVSHQGDASTSTRVVQGDPRKTTDPVVVTDPGGKVRVVGKTDLDTALALVSVSSLEQRDGRWTLNVLAPGTLAKTLAKVAGTPTGEAKVVKTILQRAKRYGKNVQYSGEATLGPGFALVYLNEV